MMANDAIRSPWNRSDFQKNAKISTSISFHTTAHEKAVGSSLIAIITPLSDTTGVRGGNYFPAKYGRDGNGSAYTREAPHRPD